MLLNDKDSCQASINEYVPNIKETAGENKRSTRYAGLRDAFKELDSNNLVELIKKLRGDEDDVVLKLAAAVDTLNFRTQTDVERDNVLGLRGPNQYNHY